MDPVGGAGAVLALATVVTQLAIKALYNQEQVKMLRRRMDNLTPIMQVGTILGEGKCLRV